MLIVHHYLNHKKCRYHSHLCHLSPPSPPSTHPHPHPSPHCHRHRPNHQVEIMSNIVIIPTGSLRQKKEKNSYIICLLTTFSLWILIDGNGDTFEKKKKKTKKISFFWHQMLKQLSKNKTTKVRKMLKQLSKDKRRSEEKT